MTVAVLAMMGVLAQPLVWTVEPGTEVKRKETEREYEIFSVVLRWTSVLDPEGLVSHWESGNCL